MTSWRDGAVTHSWKAHAKPVTRVAHLPRSGDVLTAGRDGLVKLWSLGDAGDAAMRRECVGHDLTVSGLAELEDLGLACSGSRDYTVRAWDLETARCTAVAKISRNVVTNLRRVPREPVVAQTSEDLRVRLWDVRDLTAPAATFEGHVDIPHCVDVTPDGNYLVTSSNGFDATSGCELRVWDRRAGRQILEARRHCASVNACAFAAGDRETAGVPTRVPRPRLGKHRPHGSRVDRRRGARVDGIDRREKVRRVRRPHRRRGDDVRRRARRTGRVLRRRGGPRRKDAGVGGEPPRRDAREGAHEMSRRRDRDDNDERESGGPRR